MQLHGSILYLFLITPLSISMYISKGTNVCMGNNLVFIPATRICHKLEEEEEEEKKKKKKFVFCMSSSYFYFQEIITPKIIYLRLHGCKRYEVHQPCKNFSYLYPDIPIIL